MQPWLTYANSSKEYQSWLFITSKHSGIRH